MKMNVGSYDGAIRFLGGILLVHFGIRDIGWWGLLGLIPITTAIVGWCPFYALFHCSTTRWDEPGSAAPRKSRHGKIAHS